MVNKRILMLALCLFAFSLTGCFFIKDSSHAEKKYVSSVKIDTTSNEKVIYLIRSFYVGALGPEGWVGWQSFGYNFVVPLGGFRNIINPEINGPDVSASLIYGYATFDLEKHEFTIKCRELNYSDSALDDPSHGGGVRSMVITGDHASPINGTYHTDNPDAFK